MECAYQKELDLLEDAINAFHSQPKIRPNTLLDLIEKGVPQIIEYRGLSFQRPFEGLGISGFYFFMHLFKILFLYD